MTADRAILTALRDRLRTATGPDRDLDHDLSEAFGGVFYKHPSWSVQDYVTAAPLTGSIDAALALVEKVLPGAEFYTDKSLRGSDGRIADQPR